MRTYSDKPFLNNFQNSISQIHSKNQFLSFTNTYAKRIEVRYVVLSTPKDDGVYLYANNLSWLINVFFES